VVPGRVMIVLIDVSAQRRLARREHAIVIELPSSLSPAGHASDSELT
jgi:hypothetical protein